MIDAWLLFNLSKPFIDIILQTYMEYLRMDDNDRVINKHGKQQSISPAADNFKVDQGGDMKKSK